MAHTALRTASSNSIPLALGYAIAIACYLSTNVPHHQADLQSEKPIANLRNFRFDSSIGRGAFVTEIGIGRVIKGIPSWRSSTTQSRIEN